jgi:hypothetical protein
MTALFPKHAERVAAREVDGEMVVMHADDSSLYVLNGVATAVWHAADGRTSIDEIVDRCICEQYEIDRETALRDVCDLVEELARHGVMTTSEVPELAVPSGAPDA